MDATSFIRRCLHFLLFYYTDYAKVSALAVGTIMMVSRIFDGISDIIMGVIVDQYKIKISVKQDHGFLRMCIPICNVQGSLLFSVPDKLGGNTET